jgi:predicted cobalt transporter CbtA
MPRMTFDIRMVSRATRGVVVSTFRSIIFSSVVTGLIVGAVVTVLQNFGTLPLILASEVYEAAAERAAPAMTSGVERQDDSGQHQHATAWESQTGWERNTYTLLANVLIAIGFGADARGHLHAAPSPGLLA